MRIFVLGANGRTAAPFIDFALSRGHAITAFVRSPEKIIRHDKRLDVVRGDALDTRDLAHALPGHDAVLSALGVHTREAFRPHSLLADGAASLVAAMTEASVSRLVLISAATLFPEKGLFFAFFRWLLSHQIADVVNAEQIVRSTSLAWTLLRPPRLTGGDDETLRAEVDALPKGGTSLSYRALARFALQTLEEKSHVREVVGLAR